MATYGGSNAFQPPTSTQKAEADAKRLAAQRENQSIQEQRQQAPSEIKTGTPQETLVRAEAMKAEQQRMVEEHVSRVGSSQDRFAQAREQAIKSGSFSYGSFGTPIPNSFVTPKGERVERPVLPMTQGRDIAAVSVTRTPTPPPKPSTSNNIPQTMKSGSSPVIQISQAQLDKTNAVRSSQGLPPLEKVTTVQVIPTKGSETGTTTMFGKTFKTFTPASEKQSGEVSSFLKVPFAGQKAIGGEVPSTSLADVFAFVPIGSLEKGAVSAGKELTGAFTRAFSKEAPKTAEQAAKTGTSDIGLNVPKYTEKFRTEKNIQSMIEQKMKTPPASMARENREQITANAGRGGNFDARTGESLRGGSKFNPKENPDNVRIFGRSNFNQPSTTKSTEVKLGTGIGREHLGGGGKIYGPTGPRPPPPTPEEQKAIDAYVKGRSDQFKRISKEKTVSAGKGLEQIVKEKQVTKTVQKQKPEFEQKQLSKQEQFLKDQEKAKLEQKGKTEQVEKQKQEQALIERTGLRYIKEPVKPKQEQKQTTTPPIPILKPRQTSTGKQKEQPKPILVPPIPISTTGTKQNQKQDQIGLGITDTLLVTKIPGKPPSTPPSNPPPPTRTPPSETPTEKKRPPPELGVLGVGGGGGLLGKVSKGGFRREFVGNVPEASIIGTYKRSELSYSERTIKKSGMEQSKESTGRFVQKKSNRIL